MNIINRICPKFTKGFDDCLNVGGMSPNQVLILRGLYDSTHESPLLHADISVSDLTPDDLKYYSEKLLEFKKEVNREELRLQEEAMLGANSSIFAQSLLTLDNEYSDGVTKMRRIDMVAELAYQSIVHFSKANGLEHKDNVISLKCEFFNDCNARVDASACYKCSFHKLFTSP